MGDSARYISVMEMCPSLLIRKTKTLQKVAIFTRPCLLRHPEPHRGSYVSFGIYIYSTTHSYNWLWSIHQKVLSKLFEIFPGTKKEGSRNEVKEYSKCWQEYRNVVSQRLIRNKITSPQDLPIGRTGIYCWYPVNVIVDWWMYEWVHTS